MACIFHRNIYLRKWFSVRGIFGPQGHLAMPGDVFGCHNWRGTTDIMWVEDRDVSKHTTMCWTVPTIKNSLAQNVKSAEIEQPLFLYYYWVLTSYLPGTVLRAGNTWIQTYDLSIQGSYIIVGKWKELDK